MENSDAIADQLTTSVTMGTGQFCTKPGLILLLAGDVTERFIQTMREKLQAAPAGVLFSRDGETALCSAIEKLQSAGATLLSGGGRQDAAGFGVQNTLLRASAHAFLSSSTALQTEAFGNAALLIVADDLPQLREVLGKLEGNLTGSIYSAKSGDEDTKCEEIAAWLRPRVGRLLNDKMPTGVAVSPAMQHGGPYPATSQPHFTAVGFPAAALRFTQLESYDNVREHRLPPCLRNENPNGRMQRYIDLSWSTRNL
jgi:NADP-dependent aldehyde dehydrogenase